MNRISFWATIGGMILGAIGTVGTLFQIFGSMIVWLLPTGIGIFAMTYGLKEPIKTYRTFTEWEIKQDGRLRIGQTRNVTLRADTLQIIFDEFANHTDSNFDEVIKQVGKEIGESFYTDFVREYRSHPYIDDRSKDPEKIREKINLYTEYDSGTGIGNYNFDDDLVQRDGELDGEIVIKNSFLTHERVTDKHNQKTCAFISGILEGVLTELLDTYVDVYEEKCSAVEGDAECVFKVQS